MRYFRDHQDFTDYVAQTQQTGEFSSVDPRAYVQLKLTPEANLYASAAKGFRSGGFNWDRLPALPQRGGSPLRLAIEKIEGPIDVMCQRMRGVILPPVVFSKSKRTHSHHGRQTQSRPPGRIWP